MGISSSFEEAYVTAKGIGDLEVLQGSMAQHNSEDDLLSFGLDECGPQSAEEAYEYTKGAADLNVIENMPKPGQDYMNDGKSKYIDMYA